ncbi:MAG: hypothetical protein Q8K63_03380 [Acidimicrobiales bacterium]|nr:hypothetical protein [Acidimicrobiales bacterium]
MAGDPAELAYGHALAMLGDPDAATEVATLALRRAGRTRGLVLAHARQEAVARATLDEPVDVESLQTVVLDLPALAATLASTRPPEERAALDVRDRTGGNLAVLGESLGMRPRDAAQKCGEIAELWENNLDPALLAFSGPGECETLAALLDAAAPDTVAKLLEVAPSVHAHVPDCTVCTDRIRAMASVRSFFSDKLIEVPASIREASAVNRTKRPSAPPAPLFGTSAPRGRRLAVPVRVAAAAVALVAVPLGFGIWDRGTSELDDSLTKVATATGLRFEGEAESGLRLRNDSARSVSYTLATSAQWLQLSPVEGRLAPGEAASIAATLSDDAPEGIASATIIVHTASGSTISQEFTWTVERAPELGTILDGCAVSVTVLDDGDLTSLVLHWRDVAEHALDISKDAEGYAAELRPDNGPVTYWVTASDTRGNAARTADQLINPGAC